MSAHETVMPASLPVRLNSAPARFPWPAGRSRIWTTPNSSDLGAASHLSLMSPVLRHRLPMSFAQSRGLVEPHSHRRRGVLRAVIASVVFQVIDAPRRVLTRVLKLIPAAAWAVLTSARTGVGVHAQLQSLGGESGTIFDQVFADVAGELIPTVPSHRRGALRSPGQGSGSKLWQHSYL